MNKKLKEKWLTALRSGEYKQGHDCLRTSDNKFCCLGVLCDILDKSKWVTNNSSIVYDDCTTYLPLSICFKYNIVGSDEKKLALLNDRGASLEEIANYIEKHL